METGKGSEGVVDRGVEEGNGDGGGRGLETEGEGGGRGLETEGWGRGRKRIGDRGGGRGLESGALVHTLHSGSGMLTPLK